MQAFWMLFSSFMFALMGVCVKYASDHFNSAELVFYRGAVSIVLMAAYARATGVSLRTRYPAMHAWRSVVGVMSLSAWFYAIAHLPLATAMTLNYMSGVWIAVFLVGGALMLGLLPARGGRAARETTSVEVPAAPAGAAEPALARPEPVEGPGRRRSAPSGGSAVREATSVGVPAAPAGAAEPAFPGRRRSTPSGGSAVREATSVGAGINQGPLVLAILASFAGVVMLLRPAIDQNQSFAGLIGLLSGLGAAFAYMQVMAIARMGEPETRTVFYFAIGTAAAGAMGMMLAGVSAWNWRHALWLPPIGILASLGQLAMTKSYSMSALYGGTLMVANLQYSGIVFAALFSLVLFGDNIPLSGWAGMALIIVSAVVATVLRARAAPNAPAEEH